MTETAEFKRGAGGRPTRAEAQRRLGNMLETAMRLFLERGYEAVSVEEIAKQAGVAKRFIYARYDDKSELFGAAVEHAFMGKFEGVLRGFEPSWRGPESDLYELGRQAARDRHPARGRSPSTACSSRRRRCFPTSPGASSNGTGRER